MSVVISGKLIRPNGDPRAGVTITLRAVKTSSAVVQYAPSTTETGSDGSYSLTAQTGKHEVIIEAYGQPPEKVGTITVFNDSLPGTLNDYLTTPGESEITPVIIQTVEEMRAAANESSVAAIAAAERAESAATSAMAAGRFYADTSTGLAATSAGDIFATPSSDDPADGITYWLNDAGSATAVSETLGRAAVDSVSEQVKATNTFLANAETAVFSGDSAITPSIIDPDGTVLLGYDAEDDKIIGAGLMDDATVNTLVDASYAEIGTASYNGDSGIIPLMLDSAGNVLFGYDFNDDAPIIAGIDSTNSETPILKAAVVPLADELKPIMKPVNIMQGYGQSLSVGAQGTPVISVSQPYNNITFASGPRGSDHDYSASRPLYEDTLAAPDGGSNRGETFCSGAANYALTLAAIENAQNPAEHVIFACTAGKGGTKLSSLVKGSSWYNSNFLPQVNGAYALNNNSAVHCIPWAQGETDLDQSPPTDYTTYRGMLEQFQIDAEADIKAVNSQESPVHILTYQTSYKAALSSNICLAQLDLAFKNDKFHMITPCYHFPFYSDKTHLTAVGYKWLGAHYGRAYKTLVIDGCEPQYLKPVSAVVRGNIVSVKFYPPVSPVRINITELALTTDYGFKILDGDNSAAISSIAAAGDTVTIVLSAEPTSQVIVRYGLDYLGTGLNILNGASGNICDSYPSTITISGTEYPMFHVCPHFQLTAYSVGE